MSDIMIELLHFRILTYIQVSMLMLLCYEYCILFAQEVAYVWNSKWTIIKVLYLFSRYSPFIDTIIAVEEKLNASTGPQSCSHMLQFNTIFAGVGIGISDLILIIRTYAVYQRSRKILILLVILWSVIGIANIASAVYWIDSFSQTPISPVSGVSSCALVGESRMGLINYISFLAGETVICLMTMWQGYLHRHNFDMKPFHPGSRLAQTFYRDGELRGLFLLSAASNYPGECSCANLLTSGPSNSGHPFACHALYSMLSACDPYPRGWPKRCGWRRTTEYGFFGNIAFSTGDRS